MSSLAAAIEHTLLRVDATFQDVARLVDEAVAWGCHGVCVPPNVVYGLRRRSPRCPLPVITVVGFPFGYDASNAKAAAAKIARKDGADEIDMVVQLGYIKDGSWDAFEADIEMVREAAGKCVLKAILETGLLTDAERDQAAKLAMKNGIDILKTSTGFGPRGASVEDVEALARFGPVKAAGGIRTREQAEALVAAGATRLGTSAAKVILGR